MSITSVALPAAHEAAPRARPAAPYIGGKKLLAERLAARIEGTPHDGYAEAFVGMAGVFLRRRTRPKVEVINDWSQDVSTFFRVLQRHYIAFVDMLRFQLTTRAEFERLSLIDPATLTDLERSARFLFLQRTAFGGKVTGRNFGVNSTASARFDISKIGPILESLHERLVGVVIERLPWADFLARYDRPGMLFYLDQPYYGHERDYTAHGREPLFDRSEFAAMADRVGALQGRFILSINDHPVVRETFSDFTIDEASTAYSTGGMDRRKPVTELIISSRANGS